MKNLLFVCSQNKLRSPTGEAVFGNREGIEARSAGLNYSAEVPLGVEDIEWADIVFVMEQAHKRKLRKKFRESLTHEKLICLGIPDNYDYMDAELVEIFNNKVPQFLG